MTQKVHRFLSKIFPSELTPNIYAYPEVKIINYLDAQYYGYLPHHSDKSTSALLLKPSALSSTLDPPTSGCPPKNADSPQPATFTDTSIQLKALPMLSMAPNSTSPMDQELFQGL